MLKKILRGLFTIIGLTIGYIIGEKAISSELLSQFQYVQGPIKTALFILMSTILFGFILFLISPWIIIGIIKVMDYVERSIQKLPTNEVIIGTIGAIIGLVISALFVSLLARIPVVGVAVAVVMAVVMAALGANIALRKREDILSLFSNIKKSGTITKEKKGKGFRADPKVLDTSVIIDGRIFDICQTGFIEGSL